MCLSGVIGTRRSQTVLCQTGQRGKTGLPQCSRFGESRACGPMALQYGSVLHVTGAHPLPCLNSFILTAPLINRFSRRHMFRGFPQILEGIQFCLPDGSVWIVKDHLIPQNISQVREPGQDIAVSV